MADEKGKLSWESLADITKEQAERLEIPLTYVFRNGSSKEVVTPFDYGKDATVILLDPMGHTLISPVHRQKILPPDFAWAQESLKNLAIEWDKIEAGEEAPLLHNFRQRGGVLVLSQGEADARKLLNTLEPSRKLETRDDTNDGTHHAGGEYRPVNPILKFEHMISLSTNRSPTAFLHE